MRINKMCAIFGNVLKFDDLLPLTEHRPLDTLPFDCKYRLIDFPLSSIVNANINNIFMVFNEGETRSVFDHIGGGKEWNLDSLQNRFFIYFYQDFLKQKADGLPYFAEIIDYLEKSESSYTVFMGSKPLCTVNLRSVLRGHLKAGKSMTVVYKEVLRKDTDKMDLSLRIGTYGDVSTAVPALEEKQEKIALCMDIFIVGTQWLIQQLKEAQTMNGPVSIQEFLRNHLDTTDCYAYEYTGYLSNIHDISSYYQANMDMLVTNKFDNLVYDYQRIYTKVRNESPTYYASTSTVKDSQCATGCMIEGTIDHCMISRRTRIRQDAYIAHSVVMSNATIYENAKVAYAILDKNVVVKPGITIKGTANKPVVIAKNSVVTEDVIGG
ncbi:glucose-1-phosphate adenylyltransferase subunit GlgD [Melissococcus plutonius]|nr:glucose-1-phosphate adenylyltransferase subunit GlgD [Melissococcus plutonius]KMT31063.1 glycogen biosynthesis protein GlgD [Melissococcus plutonius]KMT33706.1 glycogen biosynthesis protein GlgD [Melissococcus plutonius]KMT38932.1 glycogen biosynthesis protein GlgD [Melissococcus plutonius]MBB5177604.1 glucose-1-phosphate adenylyltransferase [Melissococcus plutonius]